MSRRRSSIATRAVTIVVLIGLAVAPVQAAGQRPARAETPMAAATVGQSAGFAQTSWMLLWGSDAEVDADLDTIAASGARWLRFDFDWASAEPSPGRYRWTYIDRVVEKARARGLRVLATPAYTPTWARPAGTSDKHGPTDPTAYAAFVKAAAQRYAPLGVHHWEIWNEPNVPQFWQPLPNPTHYTAMLRASATAIRSVDPGAVIVSAGLAPAADSSDGRYISPRTFLSKLYQGGGRTSFDAVGMHPYAWPYGIDAPGDWNQWYSMPKTYEVMVANGDGAKQIWATEYGAPTGIDQRSVSEDRQARFVGDAFAAWNAQPWAGPILWYALRDTGTDPTDVEQNFGLVRHDASPKPALEEFAEAMSKPDAPPLTAPEPVTYRAGTFNALTPARILDTRDGRGRGGLAQKLGAAQTLTLDVTGVGGVPGAGVTAVVVNVTATEATDRGFVSVTPSGGGDTSNLNYSPRRDQANLVTVPVGADGDVRVFNSTGATHVVADVVGWYGDGSVSPGARHNALAPARILDTRDGTGQGGEAGKAGAGQTITLDVTGAGGVPASGASAVTMNVTASDAGVGGFLSVTPGGGSTTSSLNFPAGRDVANLVTVPVGADGSVRIYNGAGATHVVADVVGWYSAPGALTGARYTPVSPARTLDTRTGTGTGGTKAPVGPGRALVAGVAGRGGVPATGVSAVVVNVTVTEPTAPGFLAVTPDGGAATSNLNFVPGQDVPNLVVVPVGPDGSVRAHNSAGNTHVVFDVVGWFSAA